MTFNPKDEMPKDILGQLEPYFSGEVSVNDREKILELHECFRRDLLLNKVSIDGREVTVKPFLYNRAYKDNLPEWFDGLLEKFVHVVTRDVKLNRYKTSRMVREFRSERAVRVHWIRPILEFSSDKRITRFKCAEYNGREREYFWYRSKGYMVIVEYIKPDFALITGFCVDESNQAYYMRKFQNRI